RSIRSNSIGAERGPDKGAHHDQSIVDAMGDISSLAARHKTMIARYAADLRIMLSEVARVLKKGGEATFVVGNSCLKDVFISNSEGLATAAIVAGLTEVRRSERPLPERHRYLPTPALGSLGKRMRTETILTFAR